MAAVISGNGLGLFNTTLGGGAGGVGQGKDGQYVNVASGNLLLQSQDEQLVFRGLPVAQLRTYNSQGTLAQTGLDGWLTGFERRIELLSGTFNQAGSVMRRYTGDGAYQDFVFASTNTYVSTDGEGAHDTLVATAGLWTYTEGSSRYQEDYEQSALQGRLRTIRTFKSDGMTPAVWDVSYDAQGRISAVTANDGTGNGDALLFGYDAATGYLSTVSTREGGLVRGQVSYAYDSVGRLTSVTTDLTPDTTSDNDPSGNTDGRLFRTSYTYVDSSSLKIATVTQSDGTVVSYTYQADGKLKSVTRGDTNTNDADGVGETINYSYGSGTTTVTDSLNRAWVYAFDGQGQLTSVTGPANGGQSDITLYTYDSVGNLTQVKTVFYANTLTQIDYQVDSNGNVLWQWDLQGNAIARTYSATNQLLSETRYTGVDPDRTGAALPTGGMTSQYVYDARDRLRYVVNATGEVSQITYATSGNGIGQQASVRQYTGASYSGVYTEAALDSWATTQQGASTLREYGYDLRGRLVQCIDYATVNANTGAGELDAGARLTRYSYDAQGLLRQQITVRGAGRTLTGSGGPVGSEVVDYTYDGMGRLLSVISRDAGSASGDDATTTATTYNYLDSSHQIAVTSDAGMIRTKTYNAAGRLLSETEAGVVAGATVTRTSRNYYDAAGQLRASEDATGARTYFFYDLNGRLEGKADSTGAVVRYSYDSADRLQFAAQYAGRVDTTGWLQDGTVTKARVLDTGVVVDLQARLEHRYYDTAGRLSKIMVSAPAVPGTEASVTNYSYDGANRLVQTEVTDGAGTAAIARTTRYFHDAADRVIGVLDAEGYLTETTYDRAGRPATVTRYATVSPSAQWASGTLAQLRPSSHANDQTSRNYYDARGQLVGVLDAEGYLSEWTFDEAGHSRAERRYLTQLTWAANDTLASLRSRAGTLFRESRMAYNALGQLATQTNPEGTVTRLSYDEAGRLVRTETAADTTEVRENFARYNVFGELIGELSGEGVEKAKMLLGGKLPNDPSLTETQLNQAYATYGARHSYDVLGRRVESIDAEGNKTWHFYWDDRFQGRRVITVRGVADSAGVRNAQGEVTETRDNAFGEVSDAIAYTGRITFANPGDRNSVGAAVATIAYVAASDTRRQMTYTARGLLASITDAEGALTRYTYNVFGERTREERAVGSSAAATTDYAYDKRGSLKSVTEGVGTAQARTRTTYYDAFGRVITATDARGNATTFTYDRLGRQLTHSQTVQGRAETWITTYDAFDRVTSVMDPVNAALGAQGKATTYVYSTVNRTVTVRTPEGVEVTTTHNRFGQTASVKQTLPDNTVVETIYTYDRDGNLVSTKDPLNQTSTNEYDVRGLLAATVDASGRRVELRYDAVGRVLQRIEDPGTGKLNLTTSYTYDGQGRQLTVTDPSNRVTTFAYDREGRLTQIVRDPGGVAVTTTTYTYDAQGRQVTVTEGADTPAAQVTQYTYDVLGRRTQEVLDPGPGKLNLTTTYVYDVNDNVVRRIDANNATTRFYYDEANRLVYSVDALGAMTRHWYDTAGREVATRAFVTATDASTLTDTTTIAQLDARLSWTNQDEGEYRIYDSEGRLRFTVSTIGSVRETQYDTAGRVIGTRGFAAKFYLPNQAFVDKLFAGTATPADVTVTRNDTLDIQTWNVYDAAGRVRYTVDGLGNAREYFYDAAGRTVGTRTYATSLTFDATVSKTLLQAGQVATATLATKLAGSGNDARDLRNYTVFDAAGRARYTLDALGALQEVSLDGAGRITATRGYVKPLNVSPALLDKLQKGDKLGVKSAAVDIKDQIAADGLADDARDLRTYRYYDGAGRLRAQIDGAGYLHATVYDAVSRVTLEKDYGQVTTISTAVRAKLEAGTATLTEVFATTTADDAVDHQTQYVYDAAGRLRYVLVRTSASALAVTERRYDATGRVTEERVYAPTIASSTTLTVDGVRTAITTANGDLPANQRLTRYAYNADGQLRFTVDNTGAVLEQRNDGLGRVVESRAYGQTVNVANATEANVAAAVSSIVDVRITRTAYDGAGQVIQVTDALNNTEKYFYDDLGQCTQYVDKLNQTWTYAYDAAGRKVSETSPAITVYTLDATGKPEPTVRSVVTAFAYDALGNVIARTENANASVDPNDDDRPRTSQYVYDNRGNQIKTIFPDAGKINESTGQIDATDTTSSIEITYDARGRATVQKDVRGNYSYKVYDAADRLAFEVDQEGYVTGYTYNGFGEQTVLRRHAAALNTAALSGWSAGQTLTLAHLQTAGVLTTSGSDRTLSTSYDTRGQKRSVVQSSVSYYKADGTQATGSPTTQFTYNTYGEQVMEAVLTEGTAGQADARWAETYRYYDVLGRNDLTVDAEGYATRTLFNARGEATETTEFARKLSVVLSATTRPGLPAAGDTTVGYDRTTRWTYDALGRKSSEIAVRRYQNNDGSAGVRDVATSFAYDAAGHVTGVTTDAGTVTTAYDGLGRATSVREPVQTALINAADGALQASTSTMLGSATLYQQVSPYTTMAYDAFGNAVQVRRYANGWMEGAGSATADNARDQIQTTRYDRQGRAVWERDAENSIVTREYDAADNATRVAYRLDGNDSRYAKIQVVSTYDKVGRQLTNQVLRDQYDGAAWKPTATDSADAVIYNAYGEITAKSDTLANLADAAKSARFVYNGAGLLTTSNADAGVNRRYGYNLAGAQVREERDWTDAGTARTAVTSITVDKLGRTLKTVQPSFTADTNATATVTQRVDRWGNVLQVIDARGYQTDYEYNSFNQIVREKRPTVLVVSETGVRTWLRPSNEWFYDAFGRLVGTRDANNRLRTNAYDSAGRQTVAKDALGNATRYAYDVLGNQVYVENALGHITFSQYDRLNRVKAIGDYLPELTGLARDKFLLQQYTLNQSGDRLQVQDALNYVVKYDYDSRSQVLRSQTAAGVVMDYAYNTLGKKTLESYALGKSNVLDRDGETVQTNEQSWDYDYFGRVVDHNDLSGRDSDYVYDSASGALTTESESSGAPITNVSRTTSYYANGQIREIVEAYGDRFRYEYDAAGNRTVEETTFTDAGGQLVHTITRTLYDSNNRIQRVTQDDLVASKRVFDLTYEYDAVGNRRHVLAQSGFGSNVGAVPTTNTAPIVVGADTGTKAVSDYTARKGIVAEFRVLFSDVFRDAEQDALSLTISQANGSGLPGWLVATLDATTGEIIFTASPAANLVDQDITVKLTAAETNNPANTASTTFLVRVRANSAPESVVAGTSELKAKTNKAWTQEIAAGTWFKDADVGDSLTLTVDNPGSLPSWLTVDITNPSAVRLRGTPTTSSTFALVVRATDQMGLSVTKTFSIVTAPNATPALVSASLTPQEAIIGRDFEWLRNLSQVFTDADPGDLLQVTATGMPSWMSFEYLAGQATPQLKFTGRVPADAIDDTVYAITLTATDPDGASKSIALTVTVQKNRAPVVQMPSGWTAPSARVTDAYDVTLPFASFFADPEGDQIFIAPVWPSGSTLPGWLNVTIDDVNKTIRFHGTPTSNTQAGIQSFQLTASDSEGLSSTLNVSLTVGAQTAPTRTGVGLSDRTLSIGRSFDFTLPAGLYTDAEADPMTLHAQVAIAHHDWVFSDDPVPDGQMPQRIEVYWVELQPLPSWLNFDAANRRFWGTVPAGTSSSDLVIRVTASDGRAESLSNQTTVGGAGNAADEDMILMLRPWVNTAPTYNGGLPTRTLQHGTAVDFAMPAGTFSEPDGDTMTYSAQVQVGSNWVDISQLGLSVDGNSGRISGTAVNLFQASYNAKIVAHDPQGLTCDGAFTINVTNTPPTAGTIPTQTVGRNVAANINLAPYFSDVNQNTLTYSAISGLPSGLSVASNGVITGSTSVALGNYPVTVRANDGRGGTVDATFTLTVANNPPVPVTNNTQTATAGTAWSYVVNAFTDSNQDSLTYTTSGRPSWMSWDPATRTLSGTPGVVGSWTITVTASDGIASSSTSFVVTTPNVWPTLQTAIPTQTVYRNTTWNFAIPANTFQDSNNDTLTYSIVSALPNGVTFSGSSFGGKPADIGTFTITVRASDGNGGYKDTSFTLSVINAAPVYAVAMPDRLIVYGTAANWVLPTNTFTDVNNDTLSYSAMAEIPAHTKLVWWGDTYEERQVAAQWVALSTAGLAINASNGTITGTPVTLSADGYDFYSYRIQVTAKDPSNTTADGIFSVNLNAAPVAQALPNQTIKSAVPWSYTFNAFYDDNGDPLTYSVTGLPPGLSHPGGSSRTISGTPTTAGTYTVTVQANDGRGGVNSGSFTITVQANTAPTAPSIPNQSAWVNSGFSCTVPAFSDADGDALTYSATGLPPGLSFNAGTLVISGTPTTAGTYTVTVTANDQRGGVVNKSFTISVAAAPPPNRAPVVNLGLVDQEAISGDPFVYIFAANAFTDPDGNALTYTASQASGSALPSWLTFTPGSRQFSGTPSGTVEMTWEIKVTATDPSGLSVSDTFYLTKYPAGGGGGEVPLVAQTEETYRFDMGSQAAHGAQGAAARSAHSRANATEASNGSQTTDASSQTLIAATSTTPEITEYWYTYDANNRIVVNNGTLSSGQIIVNAADYSSYALSYDAVGNEVARYHYNSVGGYVYRTSYNLRGQKTLEFHPQAFNGPSNGVWKQYEYSATGQLLHKRGYFQSDYTLQGNYDADAQRYETIEAGGWLESAEEYTYDADGRLLSQTTLERPTDWQLGLLGRKDQYADTSVLRVDTIQNNDVYDAAGRLATYRYTKSGVYTHTYNSTFVGGDSYQEKTVTGTSSDTNYRTTTNTLTYDGWGRLTTQNEKTNYSKVPVADRRRYYAYNGDGSVQMRREGTINLSTGAFEQTADSNGAKLNFLFVHAAGRQMAELAEGGRTRIAGQQLTSLNGAGGYDAGGGKVVVQNETSLEQLAQRIYGTTQLWYVIADANGLNHDSELIEGASLNAPSVKVNTNDANTFKPYNPAEAIGGTTPSLPFIKPPPNHGCHQIVAAIIRVVGIVVAIWFPVAAPYVLAASEAMAQKYEMNVGMRQGFSWGAIAMAAIPGGQTGSGWQAVRQAMASAAYRYVGAYAIDKAMGVDDTHFSLRAMGTSVVQAGAAAGIAQIGSEPGTTVTQTSGNGVTSPVVSDAPFSWTRVATQAVLRQASNYAVDKAFNGGDAHWNTGLALVGIAGDVVQARMHWNLEQERQKHGITEEQQGELHMLPKGKREEYLQGIREANITQSAYYYSTGTDAFNPFSVKGGDNPSEQSAGLAVDMPNASGAPASDGEEYANNPDYRYIPRRGHYYQVADLEAFADKVNAWSIVNSGSYSDYQGTDLAVPTLVNYWASSMPEGADRVDAAYAYYDSILEPFRQWQKDFNADPLRVSIANAGYGSALAENARLAEWLSPSQQPFSVESYRAFQRDSSAADWLTSKQYVRGLPEGLLNTAAILFQQQFDDHSLKYENGKLVSKTDADYWQPFPARPTSSGQAAGRVVGGALLGVMPAGMANELANVSRMARLEGAVANTAGRQIQDIRRISAAEANSFTPKSEIWAPPFPEWPGVRTFTTADELPFVRVHVDPAKPQGGFLVRESEIAHLNGNAEAIRAYLALDRTPAYISDVFVPSGTRMQVGVIGPQPNFGVYTNSGFQYQLLDQIPGSSFRNTRPLR